MPKIKVSIPSKRKMLIMVIMIVLAFCMCSYYWNALKNTIFTSVVVLVLGCVQIDLKKCNYWVAVILLGLVSAVASHFCSCAAIGINLFHKIPTILFTVLVFYGVYFLFFVLTSSIKISFLISVILAEVISLVETYVFAFRGTSFKIVDILSIQTAMQVAGDYKFFINSPVTNGLIFCTMLAIFVVGGCILPEKKSGNLVKRLLFLIVAFSFFGCSWLYGSGLRRYEWRNMGVIDHGVVMNLICEFTNGYSYEMPDGYESYDFKEVENTYTSATIPTKTPHIIVVMDESYADLRIYNGSLQTNIDVMPFVDSLEENTVKGFALVSTFGGGTANSEYEFLTGNTMAFAPSGICAFQHYINDDTYSLVSYLKNMGYKTVGIHPEKPVNWMRKQAWLQLGFEEVYFIDDFPKEKLLRGHVSDAEFVDVLLSIVEKNKENPLFLFGVTMQNHSAYDIEGFDSTVCLTGYSEDYPCAEQYLSLIKLSDEALNTLADRLSSLEEDVILLYYGDHQPGIEQALLEELNGSAFDSLEEQQRQYTVPFYIWANFDIPEKQVDLTSLNYLSNYLLESAGIPLPNYNQFLKDVEDVIPTVNTLGYYSKEKNQFLPLDEASGEEKLALNQYSILQYYSIFETENRIAMFPSN